VLKFPPLVSSQNLSAAGKLAESWKQTELANMQQQTRLGGEV
jgi:hypothetical protein